MSEASDFYTEFWDWFAAFREGPKFHTSDVPNIKNGNKGYRQFAARFQCGFSLVATASLTQDRLGAEFFSGSRLGRSFVEDHLSGNSDSDAPQTILPRWHLGGTDAKIEYLWHSAQLRNRRFWPSHFLWMRIALDDLAQTFASPVENYASANL